MNGSSTTAAFLYSLATIICIIFVVTLLIKLWRYCDPPLEFTKEEDIEEDIEVIEIIEEAGRLVYIKN